MFDNEAVSKIIDTLILEGGIEVAGVDPDSGEILYCFTPKLQELMPELYKDHLNFVNDELMMLWEQGYVNIDFLQDDPPISLNDKAYDKDEVNKLSKQEKWSLQELKRAVRSEEL
jgi:hypothetical protein